jgi:hypothetical protein
MRRPRADAPAFAKPLVGLLPLTTAVVVLAFLSAVIIALPLNLLGVIRPEFCAIPLAVGGLSMPLVLAGEINSE